VSEDGHSGAAAEDEQQGPPPRVLLVDDHALFRRGLARMLEAQGVNVVGEAPTGEAGVKLAEELRPDVVVMDLQMPGMGGVAATAEVLKRLPAAQVLVLTISVEQSQVLDALLAGATGYLLKDAEGAEIVAGIRSAAAGDAMISPRIAGKLVERLREVDDRTVDAPEQEDDHLTERESEILRLIASGMDNAAIADQLIISPKTVKNHVASILEKLGLENRIQAAVYAVRRGLV
jgi:two-component system, NarL family, response regulator LiaR